MTMKYASRIHASSDRLAAGNELAMSGNDVLTIVVSRKARNPPAAAIARTARRL